MSGRVWRSERAGQGIVPVLPRDDPIAGQLVPNNCLSAAPLVRPLRGTKRAVALTTPAETFACASLPSHDEPSAFAETI